MKTNSIAKQPVRILELINAKPSGGLQIMVDGLKGLPIDVGVLVGYQPQDVKFVRIDDGGAFEQSIDAARSGDLQKLFEFCDLTFESRWNNKWFLTNDDWQEHLPLVEQAITEMKEVGL